MTGPENSSSTENLEFQSLQLDVKTLQRNRETDRQDFEDFRDHVATNFQTLQKTLGELQGPLNSFIARFPKPRETPPNPQDVAQGSGQQQTPQGPNHAPATVLQTPPTVGSATLVDKNTGKELNLDGSNRVPYRHPHFAASKHPIPENRVHTAVNQVQNGQQVVQLDMEQAEQIPQQEARGEVGQRDQGQDNRRQLAIVKPAKYNIPKFDGSSTDSWIQTIELYFEAARTPLEQKTEIAVTYLKGPTIEWWRGTGIVPNTLPWYRFCRLLGDRFAETSACDNVRSFHALTQTCSVNDYILKFEQAMNLMRRDNPALPQDYYKASFISGLNDNIQHHVQCHEPADLQKAIWLAKRMEQAQPQKRTTVPTSVFRQVRRRVQFDPGKPGPTNIATVIQQARLKGTCYKCKEPWFPGHKKVCKLANQAQIQALQAACPEDAELVYYTEDLDEVDVPPPVESDDTPLQISMHALMGIKSTKKLSFTVTIMIGDTPATALIDSGSTATFITPKIAHLARCALTPTRKRKVVVANGDTLWSEFIALECPFSLQGTQFSTDLRVLQLQGYDVILGADWMASFNPVELDFDEMQVKITLKTGEKKIFKDESLPSVAVQELETVEELSKEPVCGAVLILNRIADTLVPPPVQQLLNKYTPVFSTPSDLPPKRTVDHAIPFTPEAKIINQRPYRLPHHQKDAMETIIKDMIKNKVIRDNSSPYSSPALLVKKKDMTWRLVNDFRKINQQTVKNKYPIPVIEDLLDELKGATVFTKLDLRSGYHQIRMQEEDIGKTAFSTHCGHYEYLVMPFGLTNSPATFQQLMNTILAPYLRKFVLVFFDDILIYSRNMKEHLVHLQLVLEVLQSHQLYAKMSKCTFAQPQVEYLGHIIRGDGVATDPTKIEAIS
ncbi:uncharacterized protein [Triticum aestivum]|uniref:uncharacterized protein n=1 Tax=Triticum aestivum TaxID=4565 RepID=UPI001D01F000|nr:uncharacterized protein LOC123078276 [Triticum aestivum]